MSSTKVSRHLTESFHIVNKFTNFYLQQYIYFISFHIRSFESNTYVTSISNHRNVRRSSSPSVPTPNFLIRSQSSRNGFHEMKTWVMATKRVATKHWTSFRSSNRVLYMFRCCQVYAIHKYITFMPHEHFTLNQARLFLSWIQQQNMLKTQLCSAVPSGHHYSPCSRLPRLCPPLP